MQTPDASTTADNVFPPTTDAVAQRLDAIRPDKYARSRNALDGAVTRLSPYLTHGMLTLPEAYAGVNARHPLDPRHKLVYEFGWREFFHHVWAHRGDAVFASLHPGLLPDDAYTDAMPADILEGRTGLPVIDNAVRCLYRTGYLHNHVRMWLASYVVHLRKVYWRAGADWLYSYLLDGDLASNHLSWQWVAATFSAKPYLFNADNVAKFAPQDWHSAGTPIDTSYEQLDALARSRHTLAATGTDEAIHQPVLLAAAPESLGYCMPDGAGVDGRDVWLVHPWNLHELPAKLPGDALAVAIVMAPWHARRPWSEARWQFVGTRQRQLAQLRWHGDGDSIRQALAGARSVSTTASPHYGTLLDDLHPGISLQAVPKLFQPVARACDSFSQWWRATGLDPRWR